MSMSPSAVQLLSSHINAVYFGATAGPNLAIPLTSPLTDQNKVDITIGGASLGVAIASIVSSHGGNSYSRNSRRRYVISE